MRTAASIESLCQIKDVTEEQAKAIRFIWKAPDRATIEKAGYNYLSAPIHQYRRELIDGILKTCGVEYLGYHKRAGQHVDYCNAGDTYATTVIFIGPRLIVGCWGDLVERNLIKEAR